MKVVILCGGQGTRLREETEFRPKPMVEIGGRPILWHIMKRYASYGLNEFVLCLGYRGNMIKDYTRFETGIFGAPGKNMSNNLGFNLSNTFEAKVTDKDSTKTELKKIMLLNNLNFIEAYGLVVSASVSVPKGPEFDSP